MSLFEALLLGVVQGLTEFLPVSSSGHLVLGQAVLGIDPPGIAFEIVVHLATLCAVLWVYRRKVGELLAGMVRGRADAWRYAGLIVIASIPAAVVGLLGRSLFEEAFSEPLLAAALLLVTGAFVYSLRFTGRAARQPLPDPPRAFAIGVAQAFAILPGVSRSGATVAAGAALGIDTVRMAEFSFLMSVPAIFGAGLLQMGEIGRAASLDPGPLVAGFLAAAAAGVLAIRLFVHMLRLGTFHLFAWYCWAAGSAYLVAALFLPRLG